ncbi:hypothetical protein CSUNSWCD_1695 [Campylobacter showae CSUNSWCD]|uniref:Uncharacterized protein n=1 Tax=Campylobacter showae CSUNSWCD TaxID=1244083 RepID=M5IGR9_9BACT|nr:hypothetical protein CSUNSWCD_1695 [Campylobacter showae CSUNSWCD]
MAPFLHLAFFANLLSNLSHCRKRQILPSPLTNKFNVVSRKRSSAPQI